MVMDTATTPGGASNSDTATITIQQPIIAVTAKILAPTGTTEVTSGDRITYRIRTRSSGSALGILWYWLIELRTPWTA